MGEHKIIVIGLDGYDPEYGNRLMAAGRLPHLKSVRDKATRFWLDHGPDREVGLPWEQFSTGLSSRDGGRRSAVSFDRHTYFATQSATTLTPFAADLSLPTLVFDVPGFDIHQTPSAQGVVGWGSHSPAISGEPERPRGLLKEIIERFGAYPAEKFLYRIVWHDKKLTERAAKALLRGINKRKEIALWLMTERCPEWDMAFIVPCELHSGAEAFWHGIDKDHPLASAQTSPLAEKALAELYDAADELVWQIRNQFPNVPMVVVSMHGMGRNKSDVASMGLLPELLYRKAFGNELMRQHRWTKKGHGSIIPRRGGWERAVRPALPRSDRHSNERRKRGLSGLLGRFYSRTNEEPAKCQEAESVDGSASLEWTIAMRYRSYWPKMAAFALPSFHDGRIRINLEGREAMGIVPPGSYTAALDEVESLLRECEDPTTGLPIIDGAERPAPPDPRDIDETQADMVVTWNGAPMAFAHPKLGTIGPLPPRRPGGHTGGYGVAYFIGPTIGTGDAGLVSVFDVVPTILDLLCLKTTSRLSGTSRFGALSR